MADPILAPSPVDFAGIRAAMARALQATLNLPSERVVMMQATDPASLRPDVPFATFMLTSLGAQLGWDACMADANGGFQYVGPRQMTAQFQFYGRSIEEAFGMASLWSAALWLPVAQDVLAEVADVQTWRVEAPTNLTGLMSTGYEGRAAVNATFGVASIMQTGIPAVESVTVSGP